MPFPILAGIGAARAAKHIWDSAKHPRDGEGRFITTGKLSFRVSPRSATVQYGHTLPIVPGKINLYVGALARVERAGNHKTVIETKAVDLGKKIVGKLPLKAQTIISKGSIEGPGGSRITFAKPRVRSPQIRANKKVTTGVKGIKDSGGVRAPNRKPRTRSARLPVSVAPKPVKAISSSKGKKVKK